LLTAFVYAIDIARGTRVASTSADIRSNDRQLAYFLGDTKEGSNGPIVSRQNKAFQFSLGGGVYDNYWFSSEYTYNESGIYGGLSAEFFSYVLFDASLSYRRYMPHYEHYGYGTPMSALGLSFALYGKYPFQINQKLDLYPLVGLGFDIMISGSTDSGLEYSRKYWEDEDSLYLRIGGGLNNDFSEHLRFNAKLLYNILLYSEYAARYDEYSKNGPGLSLGLSYVF
jgi:hypothetical protein